MQAADFWFSDFGREYMEFTPTTAIYPEIGVVTPDHTTQSGAYLYLCAGLIEEMSEMYTAFSQMTKSASDAHIEAVIKEVGDVLWYLSQLIRFLQLTREDLSIPVDEKLRESSTQHVASFMKKLTRDDFGQITPARRAQASTFVVAITSRLHEVLQTASFYVGDGGGDFTLVNAARKNMDKLRDRQRRSVLGGSGDNR